MLSSVVRILQQVLLVTNQLLVGVELILLKNLCPLVFFLAIKWNVHVIY